MGEMIRAGSLLLRASGAAVIALAVTLLSFASAVAQQATEVCLKTGTSVRTTRIETRQGVYVMQLVGGGVLEVAIEMVKSIGVACDAGAAPPPAVAKLGIFGSNTIGERLMPLLIDGYAKSRLGRPARFQPTAAEEQQIILPAGAGGGPSVTIDFKAHGSNTAFPALMQSQAQIGMASRRVTPAETAQFKSRFGIDIDMPPSERVLGLDGLAVIVNPRNPIKSLDLGQIAKIFAGQVTSWAEVIGLDEMGRPVTGPNLRISIHARDDRSGTFDTFKNLVLTRLEPPVPISTRAVRYDSSEALSAVVGQEAGAIGFIGLAYINKNHPLGISSTCGLTSRPSRFGVKSEQYALTRRLYLYSVGNPADATASALLNYALSDEAQRIVGEAEFIDQSVEFAGADEQATWARVLAAQPTAHLPADKEIPSTAALNFATKAAALRRSSVSFRFEYNKADLGAALDTLATQNVVRLKNYLASKSIAPRKVWIMGFADSIGGWEPNFELSRSRAVTIANKLAQAGVVIPAGHIVPYSYMAPVACSDTEQGGRDKNRRVEVWIEP